jgi:PEP-CTERM motif
MRFRRILSFALATLLTGTGAGLFNPARAGSLTYEIIVDTSTADSGLVSGPGGLIVVSLSPAFPPMSPSVSMQVFGASSDGVLGSVSSSTGTTGDLTTMVTANNTQSSELDQNFSIAPGSFPAHSFFDVFVTLSGSEIGPGAVGPVSGTVFSLNIYDSVITDPPIGISFTVNPNVDSNGNPIADGTVTWMTTVNLMPASAPITVIPQTGAVPEPSSVMLLGLGLATVAVAGRVRRSRAEVS